MTKIVVEVHDVEKQEFLLELLSSLSYVSILESGASNSAINDHPLAREEDDQSSLYLDPRQPQMEQEVAAFEAQHKALVAPYLGQFVAMYQGKVLDNDQDQGQLIRRVRQAYPNQVILFRKVEESLPRDLVVPSIRFA